MEHLSKQRDAECAQAPVWARHQRPRRPALTREAIVAAAIEIADSEGLEAVSMRRVAAHLGARTMSLYTHIDRKEDLLDLMHDELLGEILFAEGELPADWREAIGMIARREREAMLRHRWFAELVGTRSQVGPNTLRHVEQSLAALDSLKLEPIEAAQIIGAVDHYMLGQVMVEILEDAKGGVSAAKTYLREVADSGEFPRLAPLLKADWPHGGLENFERGLTWLLDGIERDLESRRD